MHRIVIVGGGFAGVHLARKLRKQKNIWVTLINDSDEFRYCPALYRSATGRKMGVARLPLEWMVLDIANLQLIYDKVVGIDKESKQVNLESGEKVKYDEVVFAMGVVSTFFNIEGLHEHAYGMKTPEEVVALRAHLHNVLLQEDSASKNFVIIGGGPTGVELAAGLGIYLKQIARKHHRASRKINVWLVEAAPRLLPVMSERAGRLALKKLKRLGVKVKLNTKVTAETIDRLDTSAGPIPTHAVIWTAGTINNPFFSENPTVFPLNEGGKVTVNELLQVSPHIYVIGDNAATKYSGLALTAIQNGSFVARDIIRRVKHSSRRKYHPFKPIQIIPLGDRSSILQWGSLTTGGYLPSLLRKAADLVGYADLMGITRALTIWRASDTSEQNCSVCARRR